MKTNKQAGTSERARGFTIIEVVLVLAIAALIFLMIFVALPALQKGQRDAARKQDANSVSSALGNYRSNSRGSLPTSSGFSNFRDDYVKSLSQYTPEDVVFDANGGKPEEGKIGVQIGYSCPESGDQEVNGDQSNRTAAVRVTMEASGATTCTDA